MWPIQIFFNKLLKAEEHDGHEEEGDLSLAKSYDFKLLLKSGNVNKAVLGRSHFVEVPHIKQLRSWDCGLACVLMVLRTLGINHYDLQDLEEICRTTSIWTVDLAYLLQKLSIRFSFFTVTLGANPDFSMEKFYKEQLANDICRVDMLFQRSVEEGIKIEHRSIKGEEIIYFILSGKYIVIALVDQCILSQPWKEDVRMPIFYTGAAAYTGHYVIICGYDAQTDEFEIRDPASSRKSDRISSRCLEEARKSYGTDEDILLKATCLPPQTPNLYGCDPWKKYQSPVDTPAGDSPENTIIPPTIPSYPHFRFRPINDRFSEVEHLLPTIRDPSYYIKYLNRSCEDPFRDCLIELLDEEPVACLISDAMFYFTQAVADDLKLPRMVLRTSSLGCAIGYGALPFFSEQGGFNLTKQDPDYEAPVPEYPLMKVKDMLKVAVNPKGYGELVTNMLKQMKASSGLIWNTFKELEEPELETINHTFQVPSFTLGPFHKYFPASSTSLVKQDRTIFSWLDTQPPKSVIYVSFGSVARITVLEFQEVAHGLENTSSPFLWVVRPGMVLGSEWLESLPEKFLEKVCDRGRVVKWCPQQEVLAHPSIGCFWTHSGWNSTLESICEGVPMICSPCFVDQPIIARYVSDVWNIGVLLEDGFERVGIGIAIKRAMMDNEGEEMRERISRLKVKVNLSLDEGGSSNKSLKSLVDYISSF
ncbi:hypothetical protein E3N88_13607 [Mikania micrantha]|uniref:UDP-glucuronosyl/UDP-glucosyltransferase n=1 Tax=Mikania micrantha TaxID=192012 RepID=A0A5N6PA52_9ASTR|nr:hypothetical protein E3N88_13607 [Mikania micrantha]